MNEEEKYNIEFQKFQNRLNLMADFCDLNKITTEEAVSTSLVLLILHYKELGLTKEQFLHFLDLAKKGASLHW